MTRPEPLTCAQLDAILRYFGVQDAATCSPLGGWANQNTLVHTRAGRDYVVKRLVLQSPALLANDQAIGAQLRAGGLGAPVYLADENGGIVYGAGGIHAVVAPRLAGEHPPLLDERACWAIGVAAARFHRSVHTLPLPHVGWLNPAPAREARAGPGRAAHQRTAQALIAANLALFDLGLPRTIIHGDLHENNVLVRAPVDAAGPAVIALLDFEEAEENLRVVDVARTLLSVARSEDGTRLVAAKVTAVLAGYATQLALETGEVAAMPQALDYVIGVEALWLDAQGLAEEAAEHLQRAGPLSTDSGNGLN